MAALTPLTDLVGRLPAAVQACVWMTSAGATFTGMMAIARHVSPELHVFEISLLRAVFGLMFMVPFVVRHRMNALRTRNTPGLMLRGALAFGTNVCLFSAAVLIPFADIAAIAFTRPIFASLAAIVVLHEVARGRRWTAIAAGFLGAMVVVRPGFGAINIGVAYAFGAVALQVVNSVLLKYLTYSDSPDTIALYQPLYSIPFALVPALFVWVTPDLGHVGWFVFMGFLGMLTQRALSRAYASADASLVVAMDFMRLPVAALIGFVFFAQVPVVWVWVGGAMIVASTILLTRREARARDGAPRA